MSQTLESNSPVTRVQLATALAQLGLRPGLTVMVHTSLKSLGWVIGGEQTVLEALRDAVGVAGTLVMPTQSWQLCDPAFLDMTPAGWWPTIREHLPVFAPEVSPTRTMGRSPSCSEPCMCRCSHGSLRRRA